MQEPDRPTAASWRTGWNLFALIVSSTIAAVLAAAFVAAIVWDKEWTTGTPDAGKAAIINDTNETVLIWQCGMNDCHPPRSFVSRIFNDTFYDKFELEPGEASGYFNISRQGVPNVYLVLRPNPRDSKDAEVDADKQRIGCLPFVMPHYIKEGLTAKVSQMEPCRNSLDETRQWPAQPAVG